MNSRRLRSLIPLTFGNRASQIYLGLVAAVAVVTGILLFVSDSPFVGIWLIVLAYPTLFVYMMAEELIWGAGAEPTWLFWPAWALSVLFQAFLLGCLARRAAQLPGPAPRRS